MKKASLIGLSLVLAMSGACGKKKKDTPAAATSTDTTTATATDTSTAMLTDVSAAAMAVASKAKIHAAMPALASSASFSLAASGAESIWNTPYCLHFDSGGKTSGFYGEKTIGPVSLGTFLKDQTDDTIKHSVYGSFAEDMDHFCMMVYFVPTKDTLGVPVDGTYSDVKITNSAAMQTACSLSTVTINDGLSTADDSTIDTVTITVSTPTDTTNYDKKIVITSSDGDNTVLYRYDRNGNINMAAYETNDTASENLDMANRTMMSYNATTQVTRFERTSHNFYAGNLWKFGMRIFHTEAVKRTDVFIGNTVKGLALNLAIAGTDTQYGVSLATTTSAADTDVDSSCQNLDKYNACVSASTVVAGSGNTGSSISCNSASPTVMTNNPTFAWTTHASSASYEPTATTVISFTSAAEMYTAATP